MPFPSVATLFWLALASSTLYVVLLLLRARWGSRQDADDATEGIGHVLAAWTALVWGPVVLVVLVAKTFVLGPLRLNVEWGADHQDTASNPEKYHRGRAMRRIVAWFPWASVGTYTFPQWHTPSDRPGTQVNQIVEIGWKRLGFAVIQIGDVVGDVHHKPGSNADTDIEHPYEPEPEPDSEAASR